MLNLVRLPADLYTALSLMLIQGARGVSLLFGSGDGGVGGVDPNPTQLCTTNDGRNATRFIANFPASCPFVTAVGATQGFAPEVATTRFGSGGGFSDYVSYSERTAVCKYNHSTHVCGLALSPTVSETSICRRSCRILLRAIS